MEEQNSTAGKGAEWGATIILSRLLYFHNRWRPKSKLNFDELHSPTCKHLLWPDGAEFCSEPRFVFVVS